MFDLNANSIFASILWGGVGSVMFSVGWKQKAWLPLGFGMALVAVSYFIESALYMSLASIAILVLMYFAKKQGY
jgi:hypothetical protein